MKHALVTGGTGFVGARLVADLRSAGWTVDVLVRSPTGADGLRATGARLIEISSSTARVVEAVAESKPDVVFHLATLFVGEHAVSQLDALVESNITFGAQVLEGLRAAGRGAFVCTGSRWQHFENADYAPVSLYAATKQAFEDVASYFAEVANIPVVALHLTDCYGPGDRRRKLLNLLLDFARTGETLKLSPGEQSIDLLHVDDAAAAFRIAGELALQRSARSGLERFAVRSGRSLTIRELVALVERVRNIRVAVEWGAQPYRARETFGEWTWGELLPGWTARIALEDGLKELS